MPLAVPTLLILAMLLNLMFHETVEDILEVFTDFNDFDIIAELTNTLNLPITSVKEGNLFYGYLIPEEVLA